MKVRIVYDDYGGYEVQHRPWWFPFWIRRLNTFNSLENAEKFAKRLLRDGKPVKGWEEK